MKKGKRIMIVTIGIICFVLTYVMFMQFRTVEQTNITEIESLTESDLREKVALWRTSYEEMNEKLTESKDKLSEYRNKRASNQEASELLDKELLQAQIIAGLTDVQGDGIVITLTDTDESIIGYKDLLTLINELRLAGAEAISINDQRIINMSYVVGIGMDDGMSFILINQKKITAPYVIKAIGDQKYLESALTTKTVGFLDQYSENATLQKQNNMKIWKYDGNINLKYATIKEEE